MLRLQKHLQSLGYWVWNQSYPSTSFAIEYLSSSVIPQALEACRSQSGRSGRIHFVTHSLGGILVRHYLQQHAIDELGRVVMLGPPNKGSEVVDKISGWPFFRWSTGPAGQQLGTDAASIPNRLKRIDAKIGIIAGNRSSDPWFSGLFKGKNDGKVSVESTRLEEMSDFLEMNVGHTLMMWDRRVLKQVAYFLKEGQFSDKPL
ncbi:alpha/beta hydrolase [Pleionea sp. CnH1-48]|nr:alpha/beta hydrolase [Pleionea sp. CnH1-48]